MEEKLDISDEIEIEIQDDTPVEDRGREKLPEEIVKELEADELEDYSDKVKTRMKQMKKVWHDERREKEQAERERQEALTLAQKVLEENKQLKAKVSGTETALVSKYKESAQRQLNDAKQEYKDAFESGDSERVVEAHQKMTAAKEILDKTERYKPTPVQEEETVVNSSPSKLESKTAAWQERNPWFGTDKLMTALALGLHEELIEKHGQSFNSTDEYWREVDKTMRDRFPERFKRDNRTETRQTTVVAPATRSMAPKKVTLTKSQLNIVKRLGVTPEQYAREFLKLES
jgi:dsDNA-specific endonuclease/ATPase MutS2